MAGFAVVMNFLASGFILGVIAIICSAVLYRSAKRTAPGTTVSARTYRTESLLAPFVALLWIPVVLFIHVGISNKLAHQSVGFSPDPYVTLPNGFRLGSLNTYSGYIAAPGYTTGVPVTGQGYVRSIIDVDWRGNAFVGTLFDFDSSTTRRFTFDTENLQIQTFPVGPTTWEAANDKAQLGPQSYWILYRRYRHAWPTFIFWSVLALGESFIVWRLIFLRRKTLESASVRNPLS